MTGDLFNRYPSILDIKAANALPIFGLVAIIVLGICAVLSKVLTPASAELIVPELSMNALAGKEAYESHCAKCHGASASGTNSGPPFLHKIYNPGHHPDESFRAAASRGVQQHHWRSGAMPAQPQVGEAQVRQIVRYIRELQQANNIEYEPHRM